MKVEFIEGCTSSGFVGESLDYREALQLFINNATDDELYSLLENAVKLFGDEEYLYNCEQCGDCVFSYTLHIKELR